MDKKKTIPLCLATMLAVSTLSGCSNQDDVKIDQDEKPDEDSDTLTNVTQTQEAYLAVDKDKCVGCGRCVKLDAEHFIMSNANKSTVISQENLKSENLEEAIDRCPVDAITI